MAATQAEPHSSAASSHIHDNTVNDSAALEEGLVVVPSSSSPLSSSSSSSTTTTPSQPKKQQSFRIPLGLLYALGWFATGNTLIGIGNVLVSLSHNVGATSAVEADLQGLFLTRGLGQIIASPLVAKAFARTTSLAYSHYMLMLNLVLLGILWCVASK